MYLDKKIIVVRKNYFYSYQILKMIDANIENKKCLNIPTLKRYERSNPMGFAVYHNNVSRNVNEVQ